MLLFLSWPCLNIIFVWHLEKNSSPFAKSSWSYITFVAYNFINDLHQSICERQDVGKEEVRDYKQKSINSRLESLQQKKKKKQSIKLKWATLLGVMGTHLKMNIPQRIYRIPLIIGKRQILQLSSGQATGRIEYIALVSEEMYEAKGSHR